MASIRISEAREHLGEVATLRGWLYNKRSSGKILFLQLRDGTGILQAVVAEPRTRSYSRSPRVFRARRQL